MPIRKVKKDGKTAYRYGSIGKVYTGPNAKSKAKRQGRAIKASQNRRGKK